MKNSFFRLLWENFISLFPYIVVFSFSLFVPYDSDMGWHLRYGQYFFQHHEVLRTNIFSTQMPGYPWTNSSWGTDLITYFVFSKFGFLGISVLGALVTTGIFYFIAKATKLSFWHKALLFPVILYLERPFLEVSFRGQLLTLLAFSILYYLFSLYAEGKKRTVLFSIPLFMFWSNIHGEFILGLGIFSLVLFFYVLQKYYFAQKGEEKRLVRKEIKYLLSVFFLSFAATFVNPFGIRIYLEAFKHFGNPLEKYIIEWLPFDRFSLLWWNLMFWETLMLISLGVLILRKNFFRNIHLVVPAVLLLVLSIGVRRYMWVLLFLSIPVVKVFISEVKPKLEEVSKTFATVILVFFYGYVILVKLPRENIANLNWDRYCDYVKCSVKSAEFLENYKYEGKLMTFYNWGGWLIWRYPEIKTSIDGRMHLWLDNTGYSAFVDYYPYEQNRKDIDKSDYNVVYMTPGKPIHKRLMELVSQGKWKIVYSDNRASIFVREKPQSN